MKTKSTKEKAIIMQKSDALEFYGNATEISKVLKMSLPGVCQWPDEIPEGPAWNLLYISRKPEYNDRNPLQVIITL